MCRGRSNIETTESRQVEGHMQSLSGRVLQREVMARHVEAVRNESRKSTRIRNAITFKFNDGIPVYVFSVQNPEHPRALECIHRLHYNTLYGTNVLF